MFKTYYQEHQKEIKLNQAIYREKHKDDREKYNEKYYQENKELILKKAKEYYRLNKPEITCRVTKYNQQHKNKKCKYDEKYNQEHQEERSQYSHTHKIQRNKYRRNKRKTDINFKISDYLRSRICHALTGNPKLSTTMQLVGCSIEFLKRHLELQFTEGMSFSNYGKWHIDHIKPCASFDLSKPSEQRKCFHYTNLQPLWATDNFKKGDKLNE